MEQQVNKLIEKIENDSLQYYMFDEVLSMLNDLLVSNKEGEPCCYIKTTDWTGKCFKCHEQLFTRN
jgi:hypothetical protein